MKTTKNNKVIKNSKNPAFPAFPVEISFDENGNIRGTHEIGLSKREYFAGLAMQGLLSNPDWMEKYEGDKYLHNAGCMAELAVERADALLKQLDNDNC